MIEIKSIDKTEEKSAITDLVLHALPEWFGIEESIVEYMENVRDQVYYAAYEDEKPVGFISIKSNNIYTADIYVIGVLKEYHHKGIGSELIKISEQLLKHESYKFLTVKTLSSSVDYEPYNQTREFYEHRGFYPLEEIKEIWDANNPCLIMLKVLQ